MILFSVIVQYSNSSLQKKWNLKNIILTLVFITCLSRTIYGSIVWYVKLHPNVTLNTDPYLLTLDALGFSTDSGSAFLLLCFLSSLSKKRPVMSKSTYRLVQYYSYFAMLIYVTVPIIRLLETGENKWSFNRVQNLLFVLEILSAFFVYCFIVYRYFNILIKPYNQVEPDWLMNAKSQKKKLAIFRISLMTTFLFAMIVACGIWEQITWSYDDNLPGYFRAFSSWVAVLLRIQLTTDFVNLLLFHTDHSDEKSDQTMDSIEMGT